MSADLQQQPEVTQQPQPEVEPPSADTPDAAQSETTADAKPPENDEDDKKTRRNLSSIQKRIDELTRERHDERRRAEAAEQRAAQLETEFRRAQGQAAEPKIDDSRITGSTFAPTPSGRRSRPYPRSSRNFAETNLQTFQQRDAQERAAHAAHQFHSALDAVEAEGVKAYPDFKEVVANGPRLGPAVGQMVLATEKPHDISFYLAKNPEHALAIASMPPMLAMREIGKLEAQFVNKRVTSAPRPPTTVGGNSDASPRGLSDELPADEWYRRRALQQNRKR
jgi:hypothetical protein